MKPSRVSIALQLALVFLSGTVVGGLGHRYMVRRDSSAPRMRPAQPPDFRKLYIEEMTRRLHLSKDQAEALARIVDETGEKFRAIRKHSDGEMLALRDEQTARIQAILTPDQQTEHLKLLAEREQAREKRQEKAQQGRP